MTIWKVTWMKADLSIKYSPDIFSKESAALEWAHDILCNPMEEDEMVWVEKMTLDNWDCLFENEGGYYFSKWDEDICWKMLESFRKPTA